MIRLLKRLGRFAAGTETDYFDAAAEAVFLLDGTAERVDAAAEHPGADAEPVRDYSRMRKSELLDEAAARGLEIPPRAKVGEIIDALEDSDADA